MKKKVLAILLAALMIMTLLPTVAMAEGCEHTFVDGKCTACGADDHDHTHTNWTEWGDSENEWSSLPNSTGKYYLTHDVTLSANHIFPTGTTIELCLNGHVVDIQENGIITINSGAAVTIFDCNTTAKHSGYLAAGGYWVRDENSEHQLDTDGGEKAYDPIVGGVITSTSSTSGKGIYLKGSLTLNGGTIAGMHMSLGMNSTIYFDESGELTMNGGSIIANRGMNSPVYMRGNNQKFTMNGGRISDNYNTDDHGGGVHASGSFTMNGGEISRNHANASNKGGGGICIAYETANVTLLGGVICENESAYNGSGVYSTKAATIKLGGSIRIYGNKKTNNTADDVYLYNTGTLTLLDNNRRGMYVGIANTAKVFTGSNNATEADLQYFFANNDNYVISLDGNNLKTLQKPSNNYKINIAQPKGGVVYAPQYAASGAEVTLTAAPDKGYKVKSYTVTDADGTPVEVTENKFTMPAKAVTVTAEFGDANSGSANIKGTIEVADFAYELIIPSDTTLTEDNHTNVLLGSDGKVSIEVTKHDCATIDVFYTVDLTNGDLTDGGDTTIEATYAYSDSATGTFTTLVGDTTEVTVYTDGEVKDSYVNVTADSDDWDAAPVGEYNAVVVFNFDTAGQ